MKLYKFSEYSKVEEAKKAEWVDEIPGGKGDNLTPEDVDPIQLEIGIAVEMEHSNNEKTATEIALDHLAENPNYYTELVEKGIADEDEAIEVYIKHFGEDKLPEEKIEESMKDEDRPMFRNLPDEEILEPYDILRSGTFITHDKLTGQVIGIKNDLLLLDVINADTNKHEIVKLSVKDVLKKIKSKKAKKTKKK